jgi:hypothetical protein
VIVPWEYGAVPCAWVAQIERKRRTNCGCHRSFVRDTFLRAVSARIAWW